ncbi:MAG: hypothetical protein Q8P75_03295, partial [bacterium]|nr:hypothetical protein [bacterium]
WQSTDAVSATSWYCLNNSTCNEPGDAGWVANSPSNDQLLNQSTAGLSGTYTIKYKVTSSDGQTDTARITVTVTAEPGDPGVSITCVSEASTDQSVPLSASGGDGSYSWTVSPTSGATLSSTSGASITATFSNTGLYTVTVTSGGQSASCEITVQPTASGDFSIISIPPSRQIVKGESTFFTIQITRYDGFTGPVGLALTGCPANTTCYHNPQTISSAETTSSLFVQTTPFTSAGTYTLTTTGVGTSGNHPTNSQLVVTDGPTIALSCTNNCEFVGEEGGPPPPNQTLTITNSGTGTLNWTATADAYWLALSSASGSTVAGGAPSSITLSANTANMPAGIYRATITVIGQNASNSPRTQPVILKLSAEPNAVINCNDQPAPPDCTIYRVESIEFLNDSTP